MLQKLATTHVIETSHQVFTCNSWAVHIPHKSLQSFSSQEFVLHNVSAAVNWRCPDSYLQVGPSNRNEAT